jgi:large subunit ribosomal protein L10
MIKKDKFGKLCKEKMVEELSSMLKENPNFILTSYMGTTVSDLEQVRKNLKPVQASYLVVKNSILRVVLDKQKIEGVKDKVDGGVGVSFCGGDIVSACRILVNFSKANSKFQIKGGIVDGRIMTLEQVKVLASLPSREVLLAQVVGGIKSPITGFVLALGGIIRKFVYVVDAVKTKKESTAQGASTQGSPA